MQRCPGLLIDTALVQAQIGGMKVKTSITLSEDLLAIIDKRAKQVKKNRSDFIEAAVWAYIAQLMRAEQNARDLEIINRRAAFLNQEAADLLTYQVSL
jgi:metal-responsive CopG/Arc/MetJ family transcriptional regulator